MSDDLNKKIKQITDILGQEGMPDNIKGILNMFANSNESEETSSKTQDTHLEKEEAPQRNETEENLEMVRRIKKVMDRLNSNNDPRINLLNAIRPFLSNSRKKKVNNCIKFIHMASMSRLLDDNDKSNM